MFDDLLARYPTELFPPQRAALYHAIDEYTAQRSLEIVHATGVAANLERPRRLCEVFDELGIAPAARALVERAVQIVHDYRPSATTPTWRADAELELDTRAPLFDLDALRERALAAEPAMLPAFEIIDKVSERALAFARGEVEAVEIRAKVHMDFFLKCPIGLECSQFGGQVIRAIMAAEPGRDWDILELGGGTQSGALSTLDALADSGLDARVRSYHFTEINPFFVMRARSVLPKRYPKVGEFRHSVLDFNGPIEAIEPASVDLAFGVNCLQCATKLSFTMAQIFAVLRPGGWLVIPQYTRGADDRPLPLVDLVCEPLPSYWDVELVPGVRPIHGMPTLATWAAVLAPLGYVGVRAVPDPIVGLEVFDPKYYVGAIVARKPPATIDN